MNASCKIIIRDVVALGTIAAIIIIMGDKITTAILYSRYLGFIRSIPSSMGWVIFALTTIWLTCRLNGYYKRFDHPFFYTAFIYGFFWIFGEITTSRGLDIAMVFLAFPMLFRITRGELLLEKFARWIAKTNRYTYCKRFWNAKILRRLRKKKSNKSIFKYDHFEKGKQLHEGRTEMVDLITTEVKNLYNSNHSFTIGLEGGWGSGKSTLLNAVIEKLKGNNDNRGLKIEVVEFSPWAFPEGKNLSVEFLYEIRRVLIKHSFRARFVVNSYINVLTGSYNLGALRMLTSLLFPRESLTDVKRKLSEIICHHKLKLVVVIDDLDRLDKTEIAEVFKMLRNTGELANSIYLVAYDRLKIEEIGEFCNGFLDKIINVEVDLNPYHSALLLYRFVDDIKDWFNKPYFSEKTDFSRILDLQRHTEILRDIANPRDINRLKNNIITRISILEKIYQNNLNEGIKSKYQYVKSFIVYLEIIKLKKYNLYDDIKKQNIYADSYSNKIKLCYTTYTKNKSLNFNNRFNSKLIEFLSFSEKYHPDYILRITLMRYFASSNKQLEISDLLGSYLDSPLKPDNGITLQLNKWTESDDLYNWVICQIPILLHIAKEQNRSTNFCTLVANLIVVEEYCNKLFDLLLDFCIENDNSQLIEYINAERIKTYTVEGTGGDYTHIDEFFTKLTRGIIDSPNDYDCLDSIIQSQEGKLGYLLDIGRLDTARKTYCVAGINDNGDYLLSGRASSLLREYSRRYPYKYFTELAFHREEGDIITSKFNTLFYMTRGELTELVNEIGGSESLSLLENLYLSWETFPNAHFMFHEEAYSKYELFVQSLPRAPLLVEGSNLLQSYHYRQ